MSAPHPPVGGPGGGQLLLPLPLDPVCTFATLVTGPHNRAAVAALQGGVGPGVVLVGGAGTGKSHLLQAAVHAAREEWGAGAAVHLTVSALGSALAGLTGEGAPRGVEEALATFLEGHAACRLVALDGLEGLPGLPLAQEAALYLYTRMREAGGRWLGASRIPPQELAIRPDLRSRLLWGVVVGLEHPEEGEMAAILRKLAADRQVVLPEEVIRFLVVRLPRRVADHAAALERLDRASLGRGRPLTVPLAKEVLGV